jgi:uncharacterized protein
MLKRKAGLDIIEKYLRACMDLNVSIEKAIVFGSFTKNRFTADSDIDIALVSEDFSGFPLADRQKISKANIRFPVIEPHTFSKKYFISGDPFIDEIKKTGIEIKLK